MKYLYSVRLPSLSVEGKYVDGNIMVNYRNKITFLYLDQIVLLPWRLSKIAAATNTFSTLH